MNRILSLLAASVALAQPVAAAGFADPLDTPAVVSAKATRVLVNGLAQAGSRLVAVGQRGHVLLSEDQGQTWSQVGTPASTDLLALSFVTAREGWAVGHDGIILHTSDAGARWERQFDGRRATALGDKPLLDVWFANVREGMAVGAFGSAWCTSDGGATWTDCAARIDNPKALHLNAIRQVGDALYLVGEQGQVWRQGAGSSYFTAVPTSYRGSLFGITGDASQLIAYGLRGSAFRSTDGGRNWTVIETGIRTGITAGLALPGGGFALLGQGGQVLLSRDGTRFSALAGAAPGPVSCALAGRSQLVIGGARGLRVQSLIPHQEKP
ncbi:MAG: YCF48-related protein [Pseudomonadota bacterium]